MTILNKSIIATTVTFIALGGAAYAAGHELNTAQARLDVSLDTNGDGEVTDEEIIDGNVAFFDTNGSGALDAIERAEAENTVMSGSIAVMPTAAAGTAAAQIELNVAEMRLDTSLDTNGDGEVDTNEIIDGNMAFFDSNNSGAIDAVEREAGEQALMSNASIISLDVGSSDGTATNSAVTEFDARAARVDVSLDTDGDGEVSDDEIIEGNMAIFDTNGDGQIDAAERDAADVALANS